MQGHIKDECKLVKVSCSNDETFTKSQIKNHLQNCQHSSTTTNQLVKRDTFSYSSHIANGKSAAQECKFDFLGCQFAGDDSELAKHMENDMICHLDCICKFLLSYSTSRSSHKTNGHVQFSKDNEAMEQLLFADFQKLKATIEKVSGEGDVTKSQAAEIQRKQEDITFRLNGVEDLLTTMQASITEINRTYEEVSLTLQTLQATSYNGKYIWKIPDITGRRRDAVTGKTVSLYSAPFYTDRFGYRICLRVYLDGDGSGKGRYISYFLTLMKGEYDALLEWPFQLTVTMTMINQKGNGNITQSFKPNLSSASFHRPKADMNVASGCPKFAVLSVLDNPEFVVDDVAFFQCVINSK